MTRKTTPATALGAILLLVCPSLAQQDSELPRIRVQSEVVLVDLIATDPSGAFISDLKPSDLQLSEDGKKQKIQFMEYYSPDFPPGEEGGPYSFAAPSETPSLVILFDKSSLDTESMQRTKEALRQFLNQEPAGSGRFMVASYSRSGLEIPLPFTDDRTAVDSAIEEMQAAPDALSSAATFAAFAKQLEDVFHGAAPGSDPAAMAANTATGFISNIAERVSGFCRAAGAMARYLRHIPGRKHIVLASGGYPLQANVIARDLIEKRVRALYGRNPTQGAALPATTSADVQDYRGTNPADSTLFRERMNAVLSRASGPDLNEYIAELMDQANRSQVSFYSIDSRGLLTGSGSAKDAAGSDLIGAAFAADMRDALVRAPQEFLTRVADQSGGLAFLNRNDLDAGIVKATADSRNYYLLAYRPDNSKKKKDRFHEIEVKTKRTGVSLRFRRGYLDADGQEIKSEDVMTAFRYPDLYRDYPLEAEAAPEGGQLKVVSFIPSDSFRFDQDGEVLRGSVEIYGALFDKKGKWVGDNILFSTGQKLNYTEEQREQLRGFATVSLSAFADLPASGDYELIVAVRQGADGSILTTRIPLKIP